MKLLRRLQEWLTGPRDQKLSPADEAELYRVQRRLNKFPRLKGCPNPQAHRNALFQSRYGLAYQDTPIVEFSKPISQ
jgi:hypothetical protein